MGAFSPYERAYRMYSYDRKNGNSAGRVVLEEWVANSKRDFVTGVIGTTISVCLMRLILNGDHTVLMAVPFLLLGLFFLGSITMIVVHGPSLYEDSKLLNLYRQIECGHEEKKNE